MCLSALAALRRDQEQAQSYYEKPNVIVKNPTNNLNSSYSIFYTLLSNLPDFCPCLSFSVSQI